MRPIRDLDRSATVAGVPELLEVEIYRRQGEVLVGQRIARLVVQDPAYWRSDLPPAIFEGAVVERVRRIGKLMVIDTDVARLGVRFGMTGRLLVDGVASIDRLEYASATDRPEWHRVAVHTTSGLEMVVTDPRRLGWVEPDPDENRLGVDAASVTLADLRRVLDDGRGPLKARLMDQHRLAGLGNLLTDEILWRSGLDPTRAAGGLDPAASRRLHRHLHRVLVDLGERGGSHTGDLQAHRVPGGRCPRDGEPLRRSTIGGRTTWWCPHHQR